MYAGPARFHLPFSHLKVWPQQNQTQARPRQAFRDQVELIKQQEAVTRYDEIKKFVAGTAADAWAKREPESGS